MSNCRSSRSRSLLSSALLASCVLAISVPAAAEGWTKEGVEDGITIYNREKDGSDIKEVKARGSFNAPAWVVKNILDDVGNYSKFMPYTKKSIIIKTEKNAVVTYQYLETPIVSNRDYTIRIRDKSKRRPDGSIVYKMAWSQANHLGPKKIEDTVRVVINEGFWQLEESAGGKKTKATYYVYTDPGGSLPSFVANRANFQAIPALFGAVRARLEMTRYRKTKFVLPGEEKAPAVQATTIAPSK